MNRKFIGTPQDDTEFFANFYTTFIRHSLKPTQNLETERDQLGIFALVGSFPKPYHSVLIHLQSFLFYVTRLMFFFFLYCPHTKDLVHVQIKIFRIPDISSRYNNKKKKRRKRKKL